MAIGREVGEGSEFGEIGARHHIPPSLALAGEDVISLGGSVAAPTAAA